MNYSPYITLTAKKVKLLLRNSQRLFACNFPMCTSMKMDIYLYITIISYCLEYVYKGELRKNNYAKTTLALLRVASHVMSPYVLLFQLIRVKLLHFLWYIYHNHIIIKGFKLPLLAAYWHIVLSYGL